ncbi:MAG: NADH:flavin oxidoreductase/NADH oxidase [Candidatus Eremiobacteraeota bacterium]|nr:NADH:flavin oxidoreductase/NADH oxidase [Candidatus Eremiobacteraeota bacterium]
MDLQLFDSLTIRGVTARNRIAVSPMCEYSSDDGFANQWHAVHLGSRAVGGAGIVFTEATAIVPEGRISPADLGIYRDEHIGKLREITDFIHEQGAVAGIQLAHAGFKASTAPPWEGGGPVEPSAGGWLPIYAPSPVPFRDGWITPVELTTDRIVGLTNAFASATQRAVAAGFRIIELHAAHGYLLHEFLSPLSNHRTDNYGGTFHNRIRLLCEVATAARKAMPEELALFVRISASDWMPGGWEIGDSVALATVLKALGVDIVDVSSGGIAPNAKIIVGPGYQVPFARQIRHEAGIATGAVGMITDAWQADTIIKEDAADLVLLARELLRQPYWPLLAAHQLGRDDVPWPRQYDRAKPPPVV